MSIESFAEGPFLQNTREQNRQLWRKCWAELTTRPQEEWDEQHAEAALAKEELRAAGISE